MTAKRDDPPAGGLDEKGLEALYVRLEKSVFNVVFRWLWDIADAQEVTQEAFLKIWHARSRIDVSRVEALVYRTALNLASNRRRTRRLWSWLSLESARQEASKETSAEKSVIDRERTALIRGAIDRLPDRLKQVIMLCEFSDLSYVEIAEVLDIPIGTVGSRRNLAMARLEAELGSLEDG